MPTSSSAKKRVRQNEARALRNKARRTEMRTSVRKVKAAVEAGDKATAVALLQGVYQKIDKAAKSHVLHANTAANHKRRLTKLVNKVEQI